MGIQYQHNDFFFAPKYKRPEILLEISECNRNYWKLFRKYHYLDANIHNGSKCYLATVNGEPAAFLAMLSFPHPKVRNFRRVHRLVVLPDYQGIGIGTKLINFIGRLYKEKGYRYIITTSAPGLINSLKRDQSWICKSADRKSAHTGNFAFKGSAKRFTTSWELK